MVWTVSGRGGADTDVQYPCGGEEKRTVCEAGAGCFSPLLSPCRRLTDEWLRGIAARGAGVRIAARGARPFTPDEKYSIIAPKGAVTPTEKRRAGASPLQAAAA